MQRARWRPPIPLYRTNCAILALLLAGCASSRWFRQTTVGRPADRVEVVQTGEGTVLLITSPSGIGHIRFDTAPGRLARNVVVRLRYAVDRGFQAAPEGLHVETNRAKAEFIFRASPPTVVLTALSEQGDVSEAPRYKEVQCRVTGPYFECRLPAELMSAGTRYLRLDWVDFYRR